MNINFSHDGEGPEDGDWTFNKGVVRPSKPYQGITLTETTGKKEKLEFPWLPDEIKYNKGGTVTGKYTLLGQGEIEIPIGYGVYEISWDSMFPGEARKYSPMIRYSYGESTWKSPRSFQGQLSRWKREHTILKVVIVGTPITNHIVYIENYEVTYKGGYGDYHYTITLRQAKSVNVAMKDTSKKSKTKPSSPKRPATTYKTYTVKSGDCLYNIAKKQLKNPNRWPEIYRLNDKTIEKAAKKHGKKSSNKGWWIYPGTKLKLPKK